MKPAGFRVRDSVFGEIKGVDRSVGANSLHPLFRFFPKMLLWQLCRTLHPPTDRERNSYPLPSAADRSRAVEALAASGSLGRCWDGCGY